MVHLVRYTCGPIEALFMTVVSMHVDREEESETAVSGTMSMTIFPCSCWWYWYTCWLCWYADLACRFPFTNGSNSLGSLLRVRSLGFLTSMHSNFDGVHDRHGINRSLTTRSLHIKRALSQHPKSPSQYPTSPTTVSQLWPPIIHAAFVAAEVSTGQRRRSSL